MRRLAAVLLLTAALLGLLAVVWHASPNSEPADDSVPVVSRGSDQPAAIDSTNSVSTAPAPSVADASVRGLPTPGCEAVLEERRLRATQIDREEVAQRAVATLRSSDDAELLLAAALLEPDETRSRELLGEALGLDSGSRLARWIQLQNCSESGDACNAEAVESAVVRADESNGHVWIEIAQRRAREGRWAAAESALRRAAGASRFDIYFMDYAMAVERGLAASSDLSYAERMVYGVGVSAALAVPGFTVTGMCGPDEEDATMPIGICAELGRQMADYGRDMISIAVGYDILRSSALRSGDSSHAAEMERERDKVFGRINEARESSGAHVLMENDATLLQRYIDNFLAHGEVAAQEMAIEDARRLRLDPDYDQCNFVATPY